MKVCSKCQQEKDNTEFSVDQHKKDGLHSSCKTCDNQYYTDNKTRIRERQKTWRSKNKSLIKNLNKEWYKNNKERSNKYSSVYQKTNRDKINKRYKYRYDNDIAFRVSQNYRTRVRRALKGKWKSGQTLELLGCNIAELKIHLEKLFTDGMNWDNYGVGVTKWQIDHIIPCAVFDLTDPVEQKQCFHYTNLQPLWQIDNIRKSDEIENLTGRN